MTGIRGAHIASVFKGDSDQFRSALPFVVGALDRNEKCVYLLDSSTKEQVVESLMKIRDVQRHMDAHQLVFLSSEDTYLKGGRFEVDRMLSALRTFEQEALAEGYSALRAAGEMTWYTTNMPGVEGLREYEARVNELYPSSTANFLCQYDEQSFDSGLLMDVIRAHPKVVVRGELCINPYFTPTRELLSSIRGVVPKELFERTATDILKRARFASIHELELRDSRRANKKMAVIGGTVLQDIQSQVSVVDFYSDLAMDSVKDQATRGYLEKISASCSAIQRHLDFMRSYQLLDQTEFRWHDLRSTFGGIAERSAANGIEMDLELGAARVWADGLFGLALQTLVNEMPDLKGKGERLVVKSSEMRSGLLISLSHEGKGVQDSIKNRVFECGYRVGRSDGYGLFLASEILRSAGMAVSETGKPGKETRFEIFIPQGKYLIG